MTNTNKPSVREATELLPLVEELIANDKRLVGLARYLTCVSIFWSDEIPTACAGHGFIFFNPDFWDSLPEETRITVLVHEVWHLILRHLDRGEGCDPYQHNIAADHVINLSLESDGFTFDGTDPCKDPIYRGKSTEEVYNIIYQKKPEDRPKPDPNHVGKEQIEDLIEDALAEQGKGKSIEQQKEDADQDVETYGKKAGNKTGNTGIRLELTDRKILIKNASYHDVFEKYLTDPLSGGSRTHMRPNRRQHGMRNKLILPGKLPKKKGQNRLGHLVWALDISGSISSKQAQQSHDGVRTIKELLNPALMTILYFNTRITMEKTFTDKEVYGEITVHGCGGTNLSEVYARTKEIGPDALVVFTDLEVTIPPKPSWESIWIIPDQRNRIPTNIYGKVYLIPETK